MPIAKAPRSIFERFVEAIAELRSRTAITDEEYEQLVGEARQRAFSIAGLAKLRAVQAVLDSLARAIDRGEGLDQWRKQLSKDLQNAWGKGSAFRLETIFRNATQTAFNRGRYKQMTHPTVKRLRPFWIFDAVLDKRTSPICKDRDQTLKHNEDPWWNSNYPPLHHRCRSGVRTVRKRVAERKGITDTSEIESAAQTGFGTKPTTAAYEPDLSGVNPELASAYQGVAR